MADFVFRESEPERKDREIARLQLDLAAQAEALRTMRAALARYANRGAWSGGDLGIEWIGWDNGWECAQTALAAADKALDGGHHD